MDNGFLKSVETFLAASAAGREQKRAAFLAARDVADVPSGTYGAVVRGAFWAWLTSGRWLGMVPLPESGLKDESPLSSAAIRENYPGARDTKTVEAAALAAYKTRAARALEHRRAGWPEHECMTFIYSKPELRELRENVQP